LFVWLFLAATALASNPHAFLLSDRQAMHKLYRAHSAASPPAWAHKGKPPRPLPAPMPSLAGEGWAGLSKVRWVHGGRHLVSVGGAEQVLFQWRFDADERGQADLAAASPFAPCVDPRYAKQVESNALDLRCRT
jgi:hypothetical protein